MAARWSGPFAAWLCLASLSFGAEPPVPRPLPHTDAESNSRLSAAEHLRAAAEQMEAAGLREEAAKLRAELEGLNQRAQQEITALEQQAATLQQKSQQLQQLIGRPARVVCRCRLLELSANAATEFDAAAQRVWGPEIGTRGVAPGISVCRNAEEVLQHLHDTGKVTLVAESRIATALDQRASATAGGEFPILIPAGGAAPAVDYRQFGFRCDVLPQFVDARRIRLSVTPQIVDRDYEHAVQLNGVTVPGLTTFRACAKVEMTLGQTVVFNFGRGETTDNEPALDQSLEAVLCWLNREGTPVAAKPVRVVTVTLLPAGATAN